MLVDTLTSDRFLDFDVDSEIEDGDDCERETECQDSLEHVGDGVPRERGEAALRGVGINDEVPDGGVGHPEAEGDDPG